MTFFANVQLERAGTYQVRVFLDGAMVFEKPLFVRLIQQPPTSVN